jgi:hypothetical protein
VLITKQQGEQAVHVMMQAKLLGRSISVTAAGKMQPVLHVDINSIWATKATAFVNKETAHHAGWCNVAAQCCVYTADA